MNSSRQQHLSAVRSVVVKLGRQLHTDRSGRLDTDFSLCIAQQIVHLRSLGILITIVSSGAVEAEFEPRHYLQEFDFGKDG